MAKRHSLDRRGLAIFVVGVLILIVGSGPLLVTITLAKLGMTSDSNPNPLLFGIMAMFTFWPGIVITAVGVALAFAWRKGASAGAQAADPREEWRCPKCGFSNAGNSFTCGRCKYAVV